MTENIPTTSFCRVCRRVFDAEAITCPACGRKYHCACIKIHHCRPIPTNPISSDSDAPNNYHAAKPVLPGDTNDIEDAPSPPSNSTSYSLRAKQATHTPDWLWGLGLVGVILALGLLGALYWVFNNPAAKSQKALRAGIIALQSGDSITAELKLNEALEIREKNAEAHLCLGFGTLGIFDEDHIAEHMEILSHNAAWGDTAGLDFADWHFKRCLEISIDNPGGKIIGQSFASSVEEMQIMAWIGQSLTAMLRVLAAIEADKYKEAWAWLDVTKADLNSADDIYPTKLAKKLKDSSADIESLLVSYVTRE